MATNFSALGGAAEDIFGGIGDFFQAGGYKASAQAYEQGAQYAEQNAQISQETAQIQGMQAQRQITQTIGSEKASVGAAGLASGGSAQYLLKQSVSQGAITKQLIGLQGSINVNAYNEEATAMEGQAAAANAAAAASTAGGIGGILGGIAKGIGAIAPALLSDARAKTNLQLVGRRDDGIGVWTFEYRGDPEHIRYLGVIAQEVLAVHPEAVSKRDDGFFQVNYAAIGATFGQVGHA